MKVLIVDDDPVVLEVTKAVLERLGHEVTTREQALGTTSAIMQQRPDIVLVDIEMPALSGDELVRVVRQQGLDELCSTAFILYSGRRAGDLARLVAETGALGAIEKTRNHEALAAEFQRIVADL